MKKRGLEDARLQRLYVKLSPKTLIFEYQNILNY